MKQRYILSVIISFLVMSAFVARAQKRYFDHSRFDREHNHSYDRGLFCSSGHCSRFSYNFLSDYYGKPVEINELEGSLEPLQKHFNSTLGKSRFIAILSPECPKCIEGAIAIREAILEEYPEKDISITIVWVDMFPGDDYRSAKRTGRILSDPRVKHFFDYKLLSGVSFAKTLGATNFEARRNPAWDIYMFYPKDMKWEDSAPVPDDYTHQLSRSYRHWADWKYYNSGRDLYETLLDLADKY